MAVNRRLGVYQAAGTDQSIFAVISLWGKFGGLHACAATFVYIVPLPNIFLTRLFSKTRLKRKDFQEIVRLTWAQEVSGSNPDAPTNLFLISTETRCSWLNLKTGCLTVLHIPLLPITKRQSNSERHKPGRRDN